MERTLEEKLQQKKPSFQDSEITWTLENIGAEDPKVRDGLIYNLLTRAIREETLTEEQFQQMASALVTKELIFYKTNEELPAVLTRSFAALQIGNLLKADGTEKGKYFHLLSPEARTYFFKNSLAYLEKEHVFAGYSEQYGWIHAFAHGADYLAAAISHPDFPSELIEPALKTLSNVFLRLEQPFEQGEERRLGEVVVSGILSGNLTQAQTAKWLSKLEFPLQENRDYMRLATFEVFLAYIYFHLLNKIKFEDEFNSELLSYLEEI